MEDLKDKAKVVLEAQKDVTAALDWYIQQVNEFAELQDRLLKELKNLNEF